MNRVDCLEEGFYNHGRCSEICTCGIKVLMHIGAASYIEQIVWKKASTFMGVAVSSAPVVSRR